MNINKVQIIIGIILAPRWVPCTRFISIISDTHMITTWESGIRRIRPTRAGLIFFAVNRVECYLSAGENAELLTTADRKVIQNIIRKIGNLIPDQQPSLCHGDLWINNTFRKESGKMYLIDPAIHYGLPEADLAMTQMYTLFPEAFYEGYRNTRPLLPDWKDRLPLYQLKELVLMIAQFSHEESIKTLRRLIKKYA